MNAYFSEDWDVPATEGQPHVPTPVGTPCSWCTVPIGDGDRGYLVPCVRMGPEGPCAAAPEPWHRECLMRSTAGSPAHLDGKCDCYQPSDSRYHPQTPAERRAEAIEVWNRITGEAPAAADDDSRIVNHG